MSGGRVRHRTGKEGRVEGTGGSQKPRTVGDRGQEFFNEKMFFVSSRPQKETSKSSHKTTEANHRTRSVNFSTPVHPSVPRWVVTSPPLPQDLSGIGSGSQDSVGSTTGARILVTTGTHCAYDTKGGLLRSPLPLDLESP